MTDGWRLEIIPDDSPDVRRCFFEAVRGGERVPVDWSPYALYGEARFAAMVALGFPRRSALGLTGPLQPHDVDALLARREAA